MTWRALATARSQRVPRTDEIELEITENIYYPV